MLHKTIAVFLGIALPYTTYAEVITDGTTGQAAKLDGPAFEIEARLGEQHGNSLFHSFSHFNLNKNEAAVFTGPASIENVISRVTGGFPSTIDGLFYVAMPRADTFFINPAGVLFGENAQLEVPGSFHVSSADYLKLGENGVFNASNPDAGMLTAAPPSAFGFIDADNASLEVRGDLFVPGNFRLQAALRFNQDIPAGTVSLVGGDIVVKNGRVRAFGGDINLYSAAAAGEVPVEASAMQNTMLDKLGTVTIKDSTDIETPRGTANLDSSGAGGGHIQIRAGELLMDRGYVFADTLAGGQGRGVDIAVSGDVSLRNASRLTAQGINTDLPNAGSNGAIGSINIQAAGVHLDGGSQIDTASQTAAKGGGVQIKAQNSIVLQGRISRHNALLASGIFSNTTESGKGGSVHLDASDLQMAEGAEIRAESQGLSDAGEVGVNVAKLSIRSGAQILTDSGQQVFGQTLDQSALAGKGGNIRVNASQSVTITGALEEGNRAGLFSNTRTRGEGGTIIVNTPQLTLGGEAAIQAFTAGQGHGGTIQLATDHLNIDTQALVISSTESSGNGGGIQIQAKDSVSIANSPQTNANLSSESLASGQAGTIRISTPKLKITDNGKISTSTKADGAAGQIQIDSARVDLDKGGTLTAESTGSRDGGSITVNATDSLENNGGLITTQAVSAGGGQIQINTPALHVRNHGNISSSVISGSGDGGHITVAAQTLTLDSQGQIASNAGGSGRGGSIRIGSAKTPLNTMQVRDKGVITAVSQGDGDAGDIVVYANTINLEQAEVTTLAQNAGGGNIQFHADDFIYVLNSKVVARANGLDAEDDGGNLFAGSPRRFILNSSTFDAGAKGGPGGNILIVAETFVQTTDSVLNVTSELNKDGEKEIRSPNRDAVENLIVLPGNLLDAPAVSPDTCRRAAGELPSRLVQVDYKGRPPAPDSWQGSPMLAMDKTRQQAAKTVPPLRLAMLAQCRQADNRMQ